MSDYYQLKNQNIFNPPPNTDMGNVDSQFNTMYVQNALVLGNVSVTGSTIVAPRVSTITYPGDDTAADTAGGQTIILTGSGFVAGANVLINGSAVGVVSVVSSTSITFTSPANSTGSYVVYVVNPDGSTAIAIPGIQYSGTPNWTTAAGTLGNVYETASFNQTVTATGDAPITYSVFSGSLPPGSTFNSNGTITGTSQLLSSPTTYSFTVRATDAQLQDTNRAFSISVIPDVVTWSNPTNNATYTPAANIAMANITLSATSAVGSGITYSANTLPTGLSLTGANISGTPTVVANTSSLLTATANTTSESSSITINWVVSVASDPYFMYNSLLLPGNGTNNAQNNTFLDGSTNNFTITRNGNTTQGTFSPYGANWSNYFNGVSDYLGFSTVTLGSNYTIEFFINFPSAPSANNIIISNANGGGGTNWIGINTSVLVFSYGGTNRSFSFTPVAGTWYYIQIIGTASTVSAYVNGVQIGTTQAGPTSFTVDRIGGYPSVGLTGYLSNLRVTNAANAVSATPTIPLTAISNCVLLTCQSNRFKDNSTNSYAITVSGSPTIQRFSPFSPGATYSTSTIGGSGYFDGSGDYLTATQNAAFNFGTGAFTVEAWVYLTAYPSGGNSSIFSLGDGATGPSGPYSGWALTFGSTGINFYRYDGTETNNSVATPIPLNTWSHVVAVRNGSSNLSIYLNGTRILNNASSTTSYNNVNSNNLNIGYWNSGASPVVRVLTGYYSDGRIVKGTAVYDPTLTTLTVPTAPLTAVSGTQLLLNYTNAGIIDNTMINNLETVGNAQISTGQNKFGSGSMSFDGTGDYLYSAWNPNLELGSGNFTIEFWIYAIGGNSLYCWSTDWHYAMSWNYGGASSNRVGIWASSNGSTWNIFNADGGGNGISTGTISTNTWTHVALVRNGSAWALYLNGTSAWTGTSSATIVTRTDTFRIGGPWPNSGPSDFNGYIDDFRMTKGIARYTSNFTPPTSAFPTY